MVMFLVLIMLSISAMASGQDAYYLSLAKEDYYLAGGEPPGRWAGGGAAGGFHTACGCGW